MKKITSHEFKALVKSGDKTSRIITKEIKPPTLEVSLSKRQITFICSAQEVDRAGDVVFQDGIDLTNYKNNPIVLWQHDTDSFPIAKTVAIGIINNKLTATFEFISADVPIAGPRADAVFQLLIEGFLNAVSISFNPIEFKFSDDEKRMNVSGMDFIKTELLEISVVTIPALPSALIIQESIPKDIDIPSDEKPGPIEDEPILLDGNSELEKQQKDKSEKIYKWMKLISDLQ